MSESSIPQELEEMTEFDVMKKELDRRGEHISPILPGAAWITVKGNFTSNELRNIANEIDKSFAKIVK